VADLAISEGGPLGPRDEAVRLMAMTELELVAKGYPEKLVADSIRRAREWAASLADRVPADKRDVVFLGLLESELGGCERWLTGFQRGVAS
jgi:hypothetical protein